MSEANQGSGRNRDEYAFSKKRPRDSASSGSNDGDASTVLDSDGETVDASIMRSSASAGSNNDSDGRSWRSTGPQSKRGDDDADAAVKKQSRDDYKRERVEIHDALEHLMVVGNAWRHHDWRLRQWKETLRPEEVRRRRRELPRTLVHPRDEREYSVSILAARENCGLPIPESTDNQHRRLRAMDDAWDAACFGDGIRLQEFYDRSLDGMHCPVRNLVLRAWERAMSVASNTVAASTATPSLEEYPMDVDDYDGSLQQTSKPKQPASPAAEARGARPFTRAMGLAQCALLNLDLEDPNSRVCRTCGVEFDSVDRVLDHYYGDDKVRGCCWILVRREQERLLRQALQDQVEDQIALLLQSVATAAAPPRRQGAGADPWDWQDMVEAAERACQSENVAAGVRMSPSVVDAATRRLVERYANVPR